MLSRSIKVDHLLTPDDGDALALRADPTRVDAVGTTANYGVFDDLPLESDAAYAQRRLDRRRSMCQPTGRPSTGVPLAKVITLVAPAAIASMVALVRTLDAFSRAIRTRKGTAR